MMRIERKYIYIGLSLVVLILINQMVIQYFLFQKLEDAKALNLTGRQSTLCQRVNLMAYRVYESPDVYTRKQLIFVVNEWEKAHITLLNGNQTIDFSPIQGPEITQKLQMAYAKIEQLKYLINRAPKMDKALLKSINETGEVFLSEMEVVVSALEYQSNKKLHTIIAIEILLALLSLTIVFFEFKNFIIPISKKLVDNEAALQTQNKAIIESENRLKAILDSTQDINFLISPDYKLLNFNKVASDVGLLYFKKPYRLGADLREYCFEEDIALLNTYLPRVLQGESFIIEISRNINGATVYFELTYSSVYDQHGTILGCNMNMKDISEQQERAILLEEGKQQFKELAESITDIFFALDHNLTFTYWNKASESILGFLAKDAVGSHILDLLPDTDQTKTTVANCMKVIESKQSLNYISAYVVDDKTYIFDINIYPNTSGVSLFAKNITLRKLQEYKLKESESKYEAILNSTKDANILVGRDYKILSFNRAAQYNSELVFEKKMKKNDSMMDFIISETIQIFIENSTKVLAGEIVKSEFNVKGYWFEFNYYPVFDERGTVTSFSMNVVNIHDRKLVEQKLVEQNKILVEIAWQQSHELRKPVANILGICDLLSNYDTLTDASKMEFIAHLKASTMQLDEIVTRIVRLSNSKKN
jgi:PAS domain S-box-containing protein